MTENNEERHDEDKDLARGADGVHRLLDILTQEVSLVTRAANKREWLVRKGIEPMTKGREVFEADDGTLTTDDPINDDANRDDVSKQSKMPMKVKEAVLGMTGKCEERLSKLIENLNSSEESAEDGEMPGELVTELKGIASSLRAIVSRYPAGGEEKTTDDDKKDGDKTADEDAEGGNVAKAWSLPKGVKTKALEAASSAKDLLSGAIQEVKSAEEGDESAPMPQTVGDALENAAAALSAALPEGGDEEKAKKDGEEEGDDDAASDEKAAGVLETLKSLVVADSSVTKQSDEDVERKANKLLWKVMRMVDDGALASEDDKAAVNAIFGALKTAVSKLDDSGEENDDETKKKASAGQIIKEANDALSAIMSKVQPGKPIDEESYQKLERVAAILASIAGKTEEGETGAEDGEADADKGGVNKAGAKMSRKRRTRFQDAIKSLIELFKEVMPESELGKMPHLQVHKSAEQEELEEARVKLAKAEEDLASARTELNEIKSRPVDSNAVQVDTVIAKDSDEDVSWPLDLNAE
jgi:hypothetical protein